MCLLNVVTLSATMQPLLFYLSGCTAHPSWTGVQALELGPRPSIFGTRDNLATYVANVEMVLVLLPEWATGDSCNSPASECILIWACLLHWHCEQILGLLAALLLHRLVKQMQ